MRERIVAFDYLRALAITVILLCHFCHNYNSISFLGHYFGGVFVTLFIAMSGMLFGIVWNNNSRMEYDMSFLKQRFFKLSVTYYPFLILMFAFLYFVDDYHFNVKNVLSHVCYLAWFDKLPNFGHLYYMTMIAICYVALYILTKIPLFNTINKYRLKTFAIIGLGVLLVDYVLESRNIPGYIFVWLWLYLFCFVYSCRIMEFSRQCKTNILAFIVGIINISYIIALYYGLYDNYNHAFQKWFGAVCCILVLILGFNIWNKSVPNKYVSFLFFISFEIYLMFELVSEGRYSLMRIIDNPFFAFVVYVISSVLLGCILHFIVKYIKNMCFNCS